MALFRYYFLNSDDHINAAEDIEADELSEAVEKAMVRIGERSLHKSIEVWQGVKRLYPSVEMRING